MIKKQSLQGAGCWAHVKWISKSIALSSPARMLGVIFVGIVRGLTICTFFASCAAKAWSSFRRFKIVNFGTYVCQSDSFSIKFHVEPGTFPR